MDKEPHLSKNVTVFMFAAFFDIILFLSHDIFSFRLYNLLKS